MRSLKFFALCLSLFTLHYSLFSQPYPPLRSAAPEGLGPLNFPTLQYRLLGTAFATGASTTQPDLFVAAQRAAGSDASIYLAPFVRNDTDGAPIFGTPIKIKARSTENGTIFQLPDNSIHALWINKNEIFHAIYDHAQKSFIDQPSFKLPPLPAIPDFPKPFYRSNFAVIPNPDGTLTLVIEIPDGAPVPKYNAWTDEWRPFASDGTSTRPLTHGTLVTVQITNFPKNPTATSVKLANPAARQLLVTACGVTALNLRKGESPSIAAGSNFGNLYFFQSTSKNSLTLGSSTPIPGDNGILLRHPAINPNPLAYPDPQTGLSNLIVTSEGPFYFYKFTGNFTKSGTPVYKLPKPLLMQNAPLFTGTLPTMTSIDWDGDGVIDIITGNSDGFVLFFKNIGTTAKPKFLPGVPVTTFDGKPIHIQAEYSGSVQGVLESRWGYLSPIAFDWNNDGLPDLIIGDITGDYRVLINRGTKTSPKLDYPAHLYCDGVSLHGKWRVRPAAAHIKNKDGSSTTILLTVDDNDNIHLYHRIDDYNVRSVKILTLDNGAPITISGGPGGQTGRCKLDLADYDGDGNLDLVIGTTRWNAIPNLEGLPQSLGRVPATPLFMRNTGTNENPTFAYPKPFIHLPTKTYIQPGGAHEAGAVLTPLGSSTKKLSLLTANECGQLFLFPPAEFSPDLPKQ